MIDDIAEQVEAARARVQSQVDDARARHRAMRNAMADVEKLSDSARSARGEVVVFASFSGAILDVRLADTDLEPRSLGRLITVTIAQAQQAARDAAADHMAQHVSPDSPILAELRTPMPKPETF